MLVMKCKMCGANLSIEENASVCQCDYCGSKNTLPKLNDEKKTALFDRANFYRSKNEFDKAALLYENIVSEAEDEAEAYWGICLCRYGIEYVVDPKTEKRVPTCHRTQFKSILDDEDYKKACKNAGAEANLVYEEEAEYIDTIQKGILEISSKEQPFDIFICYKQTNDETGDRTVDSVIAEEIYNELTGKGYKVFFSMITLESKLGTAYEPYIFAALNSARVMLVVGTKTEHFNAVWVKNEWSRYLALIEDGQKKIIIPCYKDMTAYELPDEFVALQAQDVSKIGWKQDLTRGVEKILGRKEKAENVNGKSDIVDNNVRALLKRCELFLEDGDWDRADEYIEKILDIAPECSDAYLYGVLCSMELNTVDELNHVEEDLYNDEDFIKALRFADNEQAEKLNSYRNTAMYNKATEMKNTAFSKNTKENVYSAMKAAGIFAALADYRDAKEQYDECQRIAKENYSAHSYAEADADITAKREEIQEYENELVNTKNKLHDEKLAMTHMTIKKKEQEEKDDNFIKKLNSDLEAKNSAVDDAVESRNLGCLVTAIIIIGLIGLTIFLAIQAFRGTGGFIAIILQFILFAALAIGSGMFTFWVMIFCSDKDDDRERSVDERKNDVQKTKSAIASAEQLKKNHSAANQKIINSMMDERENRKAHIKELEDKIQELNAQINLGRDYYASEWYEKNKSMLEMTAYAPNERKQKYDVELTEVGPNKVKVIGVVREVTGLGLADAKELVDNAPSIIEEDYDADEAEIIKSEFEQVGAVVTLR